MSDDGQKSRTRRDASETMHESTLISMLWICSITLQRRSRAVESCHEGTFKGSICSFSPMLIFSGRVADRKYCRFQHCVLISVPMDPSAGLSRVD